MGLDNYIQTAIRNILKNPILEAASEITMPKILKQRNCLKRPVAYPSFQIILQSAHMLASN